MRSIVVAYAKWFRHPLNTLGRRAVEP